MLRDTMVCSSRKPFTPYSRPPMEIVTITRQEIHSYDIRTALAVSDRNQAGNWDITFLRLLLAVMEH